LRGEEVDVFWTKETKMSKKLALQNLFLPECAMNMTFFGQNNDAIEQNNEMYNTAHIGGV
jgi:hypothetical protein